MCIYLLLKIKSAWKRIWWEMMKVTETHGEKMYLEAQDGLDFALRIFHTNNCQAKFLCILPECFFNFRPNLIFILLYFIFLTFSHYSSIKITFESLLSKMLAISHQFLLLMTCFLSHQLCWHFWTKHIHRWDPTAHYSRLQSRLILTSCLTP